MLRLGLTIALWAAHGTAAPARPTSNLARGFAAYRAGEYHDAAKALRTALGEKLRNEDWAAFLLGESEFYDGDYRAARTAFERASHAHGGKPAAMAPFRIADCLWMQGDRAAAAKAYAGLVKKAAPTTGDVALARFRIAEAAVARDPAGAKKQFLAIARDFPAHPLGDEALRRTGTPAAPAAPATKEAAPAAPTATDNLSVPDRLRRAESLTKDRHWDEALAELDRLPATLPPEQAAERDYQIGMTKFHMRRDYAKAGDLLLATVPHLSGDKAASAAFHGARALSRVDRDDEAIAGYRKVVAEFPRSHFAAEAQYLSGWLEYNRGRFKESLPALQATLDHFGKSAFADDAAWCLAFAHFQLGDAAEATAGLERYARIPATGITDAERGDRVAYWRARFRDKLGPKDGKAEALEGYRALARRAPLSFYGLLARARLKEAGQSEPLALPSKKIAVVAPGKTARDPIVARAEELADAGMDVEAGAEIERDEKGILQRAGGEKAAPWLLELYRRAEDFHRAYHFVESHDMGALAADPHADDGVRAFWEAAFPRAYAPLVDRYGPPAGNPELYLYAIMRKESGFDPHDVSYADARGLLQMIPPTSARVAAKAGDPFYPDQLYDPEVNIRLGALYIGALYKKFGGEVPLAAGAYNAGPRAMARWCTQHGTHPTDEFVELVAFAQTREYVKRVTSLYATYRFLYGPKPYEIPLTLNTKVSPEGPDY
ncbi:MAG TPA: transglycosylase SLT domain-containing protein [Polyangia bacterium]|nr:transglycosylase SLT domain-containing protein [Polyangia bacterium]